MIKYSDYDNYHNPQIAKKYDDETGELLGTFRNSYGDWIQIKNIKPKFKLSKKTGYRFNPPENQVMLRLKRGLDNGTREIKDSEDRDIE